MNEIERKDQAWKEYREKANNFLDWFTAIIISNFVYLINFLDKEGSLVDRLNGKTHFWKLSFNAAAVALAAVFIVKALGVLAADFRVNGKYKRGEELIEAARTGCVFMICFLGIVSLSATFVILKSTFFNSL